MLMLETRAGDAGLVLDWKCEHCGRFLARVVGDRFERPNGDSGHLPAVLRCKCGKRNVRAEEGS